VTEIGEFAFYNSGLQSICFGSNSKLVKISSYIFQHCSKLTSIEIPANIEEIGDFAFAISGLESVRLSGLPSGLKISQKCTFSDCANLSCVEIPSFVEEIGEDSFSNSLVLVECVLFAPNSKLKKIRTRTFRKCALKTI